MTHPFEFLKRSIAPWERPSVLSQWPSSHSSLLSNGAYPPSPACLANFSHRVSWQPSRGFPALVSMITFKCGVGGDAPLSALSASNPEVCPGPREEPGSQSQSDPSGSCCPVPGGVLWWFGVRMGSWEVLGSWGLLLSCFATECGLPSHPDAWISDNNMGSVFDPFVWGVRMRTYLTDGFNFFFQT